jgi:hypothetical protein
VDVTGISEDMTPVLLERGELDDDADAGNVQQAR